MINGKNCLLVKTTGIKPFRRCSYCERNLRNCFGFQFFFIVLSIIGLLLTMFLIQDLPALVIDFNILILLLLALLGYIAGQETNEIVVGNHLLKELNEELEKRVFQKTKELRLLNLELQKALRMKSESMKGFGHDLKTPLTAIQGYCDILTSKQSGDLNEAQMKFVVSIKRNGETLLSLINSLLGMSKIKTDACQSEETQESLGRIISGAVVSLEPMALKKNIVIKSMINEGLNAFPANRECTEQILINLISNAIKFTPNAGSIFVEAKDMDDEILISVRDTGHGINPERLKNIFDLTPSQSGSNESQKIGLSIVKSLVESGGGTVRAESELEKGSTFSFTIPK